MIEATKRNVNPNGEIMRELRARLDFSQEDLAKALGIARRTIYSAEAGTHEIRLTITQIRKLVELLDRANMSIYDLPPSPNADEA